MVFTNQKHQNLLLSSSHSLARVESEDEEVKGGSL